MKSSGQYPSRLAQQDAAGLAHMRFASYLEQFDKRSPGVDTANALGKQRGGIEYDKFGRDNIGV